MKYRKKPLVIDAIQWNRENFHRIVDFVGFNNIQITADGQSIVIPTLEGSMSANINDYIIRGIKGEFYPCKPDIFEATYEAVGE